MTLDCTYSIDVANTASSAVHAIASGIFHIIPAPVLSNHALTITPSSINGGALTPDLSAAATAGGTPLLPTATFTTSVTFKISGGGNCGTNATVNKTGGGSGGTGAV